MERRAFLEKLEIVEPALSNHRLIPVMTCLWFTGDELLAYNDVISISTPLKTEFKGALPGSTLIGMMKSSRAKNLEFMADKDVLNVKATSSRLKLALMPSSSFCFEMPEEGNKKKLGVDMNKFLEWIALCLKSVGGDATVPDQLGVTLLPKDGTLYMYATDNSTITAAQLPIDGGLKERTILPTQFCEQMIRICRGHKDASIEITSDYALVVAGENRLFGRLIESDRPVKFMEMVRSHYPEKVHNQPVPLPDKFEGILERAIIITDAAVERNYTTVSVADGVMKFFSKTERGQVSDTTEVADHPEMEVNIEPKLLKNAIGSFDKMLMTNDCAVFVRKDALYLVASRAS